MNRLSVIINEFDAIPYRMGLIVYYLHHFLIAVRPSRRPLGEVLSYSSFSSRRQPQQRDDSCGSGTDRRR